MVGFFDFRERKKLFLFGSHGLDARRAQRTKSRGEKLEIGMRRAPNI